MQQVAPAAGDIRVVLEQWRLAAYQNKLPQFQATLHTTAAWAPYPIVQPAAGSFGGYAMRGPRQHAGAALVCYGCVGYWRVVGSGGIVWEPLASHLLLLCVCCEI